MLEDIGQFKISVHDFILDQGLEGMEDLNKIFDSLVFVDLLLLLEVSPEVSLVAVVQDQIDVVGSLLDVDEANDVVIFAGLEHFYLVVEEFGKLSYIPLEVPLILDLLMVLMATSVPSTLL